MRSRRRDEMCEWWLCVLGANGRRRRRGAGVMGMQIEPMRTRSVCSGLPGRAELVEAGAQVAGRRARRAMDGKGQRKWHWQCGWPSHSRVAHTPIETASDRARGRRSVIAADGRQVCRAVSAGASSASEGAARVDPCGGAAVVRAVGGSRARFRIACWHQNVPGTSMIPP